LCTGIADEDLANILNVEKDRLGVANLQAEVKDWVASQGTAAQTQQQSDEAFEDFRKSFVKSEQALIGN